MHYKKSILLLLSLILYSLTNAQITVTNTLTPQQLVENILIGAGVNASNVMYNGSAISAQNTQTNVSFFNAQNTTFPMSSGVLLTSGNGSIAVGPNNDGMATDASGTSIVNDPDLSAITPNTVTNGVVLEFDFMATGDTLNFKYIFASEEYPSDFGGSFYDVFGFFISGAGFSGPYSNGGVNIATLPGTSTPISILNLNPTTNSQYYVSNENGAGYGTAIQYDGTSVVLTASASLICGESYHIKMAIANVGDQSYDSGVFLLSGSFASNVIDIQSQSLFQGSFTDTLLAENCTTNNLLFIRPQELIDSLQIFYIQTSGTANPLTDFSIPIPDSLIFYPGDDTLSILLNPIADGIIEGLEYIQFMGYSITPCGDTIYDSLRIYITDHYNLTYDLIDTLATQCITNGLEISVQNFSNSIPPFQTNWSFGGTSNPVILPENVSFQDTIMYYIEIIDGCGTSFPDSMLLIVNQTLVIDSVSSMPSHACDPDGSVKGFAHGFTGTANYNWSGPGPNSPNNIDASAWQDLSPGWYYFTVTDNVCSIEDSVFVDPIEPPIANISANTTQGCGPLTVIFTNSSENTNTYKWDFGNGVIVDVNTLAPQTQTFTSSTTVTLTAYQDETCSDATSLFINIANCGCTDPEALNYDPTAVLNDGSCTYPAPVLIVGPNVFTPNNDGNNDMFFLTIKYAENIELTIVNRWGNVIYKGSGIQPAWNGKTESGNYVSEGVYFYKYTATGIMGDKIEGHGFIQLVIE